MDIIARITDPSASPFVVAELSGNHGGKLEKAIQLVVEAKQAGADAIKLQTYRPDTITVEGKDDRFLLKSGLWKGKYLHDLYHEAMTPWEWHPILAQEASKLDMVCFSSPFDESAVDFLEESIDPPLYKVASFELNHFPLLTKTAHTGKPVMASTGVSQKDEIDDALRVLRASGCSEIILLHCVSEYPAQPKDFCLQNMVDLKKAHHVEYGLSDHSMGNVVAIAATALGARVIEKHLCLDRDEESIDGQFSMLPHEFAEMVQSVRMAHLAISGKKDMPLSPSAFKRSILVSSPISVGDQFTEKNIRIARPSGGLCPSRWDEILNYRANKDMPVGHPLSEDDWIKE